jgi:hypothetical protein
MWLAMVINQIDGRIENALKRNGFAWNGACRRLARVKTAKIEMSWVLGCPILTKRSLRIS